MCESLRKEEEEEEGDGDETMMERQQRKRKSFVPLKTRGAGERETEEIKDVRKNRNDRARKPTGD